MRKQYLENPFEPVTPDEDVLDWRTHKSVMEWVLEKSGANGQKHLVQRLVGLALNGTDSCIAENFQLKFVECWWIVIPPTC